MIPRQIPGVLCAALYLAFTLPLVPEGADDIRMAAVFSVDESSAAAVVRHLHRSGTLELTTFSYGGAFYYVPLLAVRVLAGIGVEVTDRVIIVVMRGVCVAAGLGCLWMSYRIGAAVFGRPAGLVGSYLLLSSPAFLRWSVETHPDLPQLFWLLWGLLCCSRLCRRFSVRGVAHASLAAGLAFSTKYAGVFLLPLIAAAAVIADDGTGRGLRNQSCIVFLS